MAQHQRRSEGALARPRRHPSLAPRRRRSLRSPSVRAPRAWRSSLSFLLAALLCVPAVLAASSVDTISNGGARTPLRETRRGAHRHPSFLASPPSKANAKTTSSSSTALRVKCKSFDDMLASHGDTPLLIDFYASWCGPCKMMKSELSGVRSELETLGPVRTPSPDDEEGAASQPTGIAVYHVNTNRFPQVGARNQIHGLPTLVLFYLGDEVWRNEGFMRGRDVIETLRGLQEGGCWEATRTKVATLRKEEEKMRGKEMEGAGAGAGQSTGGAKRKTRGLGD